MLEELALNVMTHGRDGGARHLDVIVGSTPDAITVELVDDGPRFDPLQEAPEFDAELSIDERRIGGVGGAPGAHAGSKTCATATRRAGTA